MLLRIVGGVTVGTGLYSTVQYSTVLESKPGTIVGNYMTSIVEEVVQCSAVQVDGDGRCISLVQSERSENETAGQGGFLLVAWLSRTHNLNTL